MHKINIKKFTNYKGVYKLKLVQLKTLTYVNATLNWELRDEFLDIELWI